MLINKINKINKMDTRPLEFLKNLIQLDTLIEDDIIIVKDKILRIKPQIVNYSINRNIFVVTTMFKVKNPLFDSDFIEHSTGVSDSFEDALLNSCNSFVIVALSSIINFIDEIYFCKLNSDFFGVNKEWQCSKGDSLIMGVMAKNKIDFWHMIKDLLVHRLGNRKYYYIKVYAAKQSNGDYKAEVRINNVVDNELSDLVKQNTKLWDVGDKFCSKKQFFLLYQGEKTYLKYPFSYVQTYDYVLKTINIILDNKPQNSDDYIKNMLFELTNDKIFAIDLFNFIPEICARNCFDFLNFRDEIVFLKHENIKIEINKSKSTSFEIIKNTLDEIFAEKIFDDEEIKFIVMLSSVYNLLSNLKKENMLKKEVCITNFFKVPSNYFVR